MKITISLAKNKGQNQTQDQSPEGPSISSCIIKLFWKLLHFFRFLFFAVQMDICLSFADFCWLFQFCKTAFQEKLLLEFNSCFRIKISSILESLNHRQCYFRKLESSSMLLQKTCQEKLQLELNSCFRIKISSILESNVTSEYLNHHQCYFRKLVKKSFSWN